jgi:hypothetical protein
MRTLKGFVLCGVFAVIVLKAQEFPADLELNTVSGQNCTFLADPDAFLKHDLRIRQMIQDRLDAFDKMRAASITPHEAAAAVPGTNSKIPRKNFIDDEIFNRLDTEKVAAAPLSSDEEFFRRINLDLTGRIPSPADVTAFVADKNPSKRSALIDKLLYTPEYADKWTMWFGDLVENNATSVDTTRQISGRNAFYKFLWGSIIDQNSMKDTVYQIVSATGNNYDEPSPAGYILNGNAPGGPIQDTYDMMLVKSAKQFLGLGHYDCLLCHNGRGHLDALSRWGYYTTRADAEHMAAFFARTQMRGYTFPAGTSADSQRASFYYQSQVVSNNTNGTYALPTTYGNRPNRPTINNLRTVDPIYRTGQKPPSANWRADFADFLVHDPMFAINMVNRVWKQMFNLGLVDTVDALDPMRLDPDNPPEAGWSFQATHPVLLQKLAKEFVARNYNLRELIRLIAESSAYQLSSRYSGDWSLNYVPLFARHYPRRLSGEEIHDAIAKSTGVFTKYTVQGWGDPVVWAMQLPDTSEPRSNGTANNFMNLFLRGNRDLVPRSQGSTILQSLGLMNDPFVNGKIHMNQSPTLQAVAKLPNATQQFETMYLTFLGRMPSDYERSRGMAYLNKATTTALRNTALEDLTWALINKLEFQFSY